jgi:hypothetical protein
MNIRGLVNEVPDDFTFEAREKLISHLENYVALLLYMSSRNTAGLAMKIVEGNQELLLNGLSTIEHDHADRSSAVQEQAESLGYYL